MIFTIIYESFDTTVQVHSNMSMAVAYIAKMDTILDSFQYDIIEGDILYSNDLNRVTKGNKK